MLLITRNTRSQFARRVERLPCSHRPVSSDLQEWNDRQRRRISSLEGCASWKRGGRGSGRCHEPGRPIQRSRHDCRANAEYLPDRIAAPCLRVRRASTEIPDEPPGTAVAPVDLLRTGRAEDEGNDVWRTMNVVRAIREDVRLNVGLWDRAMREIT
jgi:hypothetical protein